MFVTLTRANLRRHPTCSATLTCAATHPNLLLTSCCATLTCATLLHQAELFDNCFFAISEPAAEAGEMDPQQRLLLERRYEAVHEALHMGWPHG